MVAQIDEQQIAMVALAMDPTGQASGRASVSLTQLATRVRSIEMHRSQTQAFRGF
jgi:hypothetical protein